MIKKEIAELKEILDRIEVILDDTSETCRKREDGEMYLNITDDNEIEIVVKGYLFVVGKIRENGECHIMCCKKHHETWEYWKEKGMKVDSTSVKWRGKEYCITDSRELRCNIASGLIYNLKRCCPEWDCEDNNIQRHSNGTPKIF